MSEAPEVWHDRIARWSFCPEAQLSRFSVALELRKRFGMSFQEGALFDSMTVYDNVALPLDQGTTMSRDEIRTKVHERLQQLDLAGIDHKYPSELSGGMQKRVAMARALVTAPDCVLADEPTGNLDSKMGEEVMGILESYNKSAGVTVIMVTHDPDLAARAQRNIHILDGRASDQPMPAAAVVTKLEARREAAHV